FLGWHGLTPLHKACLRTEPYMISLLLQTGADPNAKSDFDETPLHYACKQGIPNIIYLLLQYGADLIAVDKLGRGAMHHAAVNGNVLAMHYLHEVHGLAYDVQDNELKSPLHIVSSHAHLDAVKYLLKSNRCNPHLTDVYGNNSLHFACKHGHAQIAWQLLVAGGCRLLHSKNKDGHTPIEVARAQKTSKSTECSRLLSYYMYIKDEDYRPAGPTVPWLWHLTMPAVLYIVALVLAYLLQDHTGSQGLIVFGELALFIFLSTKHQHRMLHVCRWPNPLFAGGFAAGLFITLACYYLQMFSYVSHHHYLNLLSISLTVVMLYMYWRLWTRDPGVVRVSALKPNNGGYYSVRDVATGQVSPEMFCTTCEIVRPLRSKHCKLCEQCIQGMDHHCLFLLRCVAKYTHRLFILFIITVLCSQVLFLVQVYLYYQAVLPSVTSNDWFIYVKSAFNQHAWVLSLSVLNLGSILWGLKLLKFQLSLVSKGYTTVFQPHFQKGCGLSKLEMVLNVIYFIAGKGLYLKDPLFDV
ncbi:putative ZDHHC-type palmitoyltransferase 5, partial [Lingula anatina]|uniref:Palmitoyltransferase n=1 Tax=Lingula anatina TaxID=7574 RepID=A0A1S3K9J7_LINAN